MLLRNVHAEPTVARIHIVLGLSDRLLGFSLFLFSFSVHLAGDACTGQTRFETPIARNTGSLAGVSGLPARYKVRLAYERPRHGHVVRLASIEKVSDDFQGTHAADRDDRYLHRRFHGSREICEIRLVLFMLYLTTYRSTLFTGIFASAAHLDGGNAVVVETSADLDRFFRSEASVDKSCPFSLIIMGNSSPTAPFTASMTSPRKR